MSSGSVVESGAQGGLSKATIASLLTETGTVTKDTVDLTESSVHNQRQDSGDRSTTRPDQIKQLDTPKSMTRPDPALISEFDPFASNTSSSANPLTDKISSATPIPTSLPSESNEPSESTKTSNTFEVSGTPPLQTPKEGHKAEAAHVPRKAGNVTQPTQSSNESPLAMRQKQNRTRSTEEADNQHRHASALISKGESRTNPKLKELAFDFQGFLAQLRTKQAEPIQKYLKR